MPSVESSSVVAPIAFGLFGRSKVGIYSVIPNNIVNIIFLID